MKIIRILFKIILIHLIIAGLCISFIVNILPELLIKNKDIKQNYDAAVILSLKNSRLRYGAQLYTQSKTKKIIIVPGNFTGAEELRIIGLELKIIDIFKDVKKYLIKNGVKDKDIILSSQIAESTFQEANITKTLCKQNKIHSLLIVTSAFHTRRALRIFNIVFNKEDNAKIDIGVIGVPIENDKMSLDSWYTREKEMIFIFEESIKNLLYFFKY